jgi:hypothetical protein
VRTDRGLWRPRLWHAVRAAGLQPLLRVQQDVRGAGGPRQWCAAKALVQQVGQAWIGRAVVHNARSRRRWGTVVVVWAAGPAQPGVVCTDLPPGRVGVRWYGLRMGRAGSCRACTPVGWDGNHTRRRDPTRVRRSWLRLAVARLWLLAAGTAGAAAGHDPPALPPPRPGQRPLRVLPLGLAKLRAVFLGTGPWPALPLVPERWPTPPPGLPLTDHPTPPKATWATAYLPL